MSEEITEANVPPVEESGLPSDTVESTVSPFSIPEDRITDGKLDGRWDSFESMNKSYDEIVGAYGAAKEELKGYQEGQSKAESNKVQETAIMDMLPEYMDNGMQLTEEMTTKATEAGIDPRDLKIGAMEMQKRIEVAHNLVGGKDTYEQMKSDMVESMTDDQKRAFNKDVNSGMGEYAIRGLHQAWMDKTGRREVPQRIRGNQPGNNSGVKPYANQNEMMKDLSYLRTNKGRNDSAAQKKYESRKRATPDNVVYGT